MLHGGACLARDDDGQAVLVDGAIPGELVEAAPLGRQGGVARARATRILEPSAARVDAPCPVYGVCGGCDLQHVAYARQLELKRDIVVDAMRRAAVPIPEEVVVHGMADPWRYRRRAELHLVRDRSTREVAGVGFNRVRSWRPVAIDDCLIHHPAITGAFGGLVDAAREGATPACNVLHLTVGEGGEELLVEPRPAGSLAPPALEAAALGRRRGPARWAVSATTLRWRGHSYRVTPGSFVQVSEPGMEVLYDRAIAALGDIDGAAVVDAYAGVGILAVELAVLVGEAGTVRCIESNRAAAMLGVLNARINGVEDRITYEHATAERALAGAAGGASGPVLLDPPRAGCAGAVTGWLALAGPDRLVYVSCDPATLARDLHLLVASGPYRVTTLEVVDMFPQTHHVECVVSLRRGR